MGGIDKRTRLFDLGAAAIQQSAIVKDAGGQLIRDAYPCPLCMRFFTRRALGGHLTIEHVPPAAVGGAPLVLTCRDCNNRAGVSIDAELARHDRLQQQLRGDLPMPVRIDGLNALLERRASELHVAVDVKHNDPAQVGEWVSQVQAGSAALTIVGSVRYVPSEEPVRISMLRAAFLAVFAREGYRHVLGTAYLPFRRQMSALHAPMEPLPVFRKPGWPGGIRVARHPTIGLSWMFGWREWRVLLPYGPDDTDWLDRVQLELRSNTAQLAAHRRNLGLPPVPLHRLDLTSKLEGEIRSVQLT